MSRILVAEQIADAGLDKLRAAGHEVDVRLELSPEGLIEEVAGAHALIIRSATDVTQKVLAAGSELVVVGRAGIGLDNVDIEAATKQGVLVVNAPQSNVMSAAEQTMALILAQARNTAQADAALKAGRWDRSSFTGIELYGKTLGIVGLGRIGKLVAQRAHGFDMQLIGYDPYVSDDRAREMAVELVDLDQLAARSDIITMHVARTPETIGLIDAEFLAMAKDGVRIVNVSRGGIVDEAALYDALVSGKAGGAALDVFDDEPCTDSPLFTVPSVVVTPHLGASTREAQDRAGITVAEQVLLALSGDFVPFAVNIDAADVSGTLEPYLPLAEQLGAILGSLGRGAIGDRLEVVFEGEIGGYDNSLVSLAAAKGLLSQLVDEPVSFVNARGLLEELGISLRISALAQPRDYVNRLAVQGEHRSLTGTLIGVRDEARIVQIDDHIIDVPPSDYMLIVSNDDRPGVIGKVGTVLGDAGVNIDNMDVGRPQDARSAIMVIAVTEPLPPGVVEALRASDGVLSVDVIDID
ncbi:MAG: phosphoglycerate dehydrogenase [Acidimicrobiia bacterium]|nr:phosphoglycerate dehydrogenase [Acidimicrobiia bacterium]